MRAGEVLRWNEYFQTHTFLTDKIEFMLANIGLILAEANRNPKKRAAPFTIEDFLLDNKDNPSYRTPAQAKEPVNRLVEKGKILKAIYMRKKKHAS